MARNRKEPIMNRRNLHGEFSLLFGEILRLADMEGTRLDFLNKILHKIADFADCDAVEIIAKSENIFYRYECSASRKEGRNFEIIATKVDKDGQIMFNLSDTPNIGRFLFDIYSGNILPKPPYFTPNGSFYIGNSRSKVKVFSKSDIGGGYSPKLPSKYMSLAIIPFIIDVDNKGIILLKDAEQDSFTSKELELFEGIARIIGLTIAYRRSQLALKERVKELTCLYGVSQIALNPEFSVDEILQGIVELLPPAWRFPEIAAARIVFDDIEYATPNFRESSHKLVSEILINGGKKRGFVEVAYIDRIEEFEFGVFLNEEKNLIDIVARQIALIMERKHTEEQREKLQAQLRHADRLATMGQLAAGVAHELNEPLSAILGFGQLIKKNPKIADSIREDIEKIINASMHAREVVKKLLIFGRAMPSQKTEVDLNQIIENGIYFLESRCAKEGIELTKTLAHNIPIIIADQSQLQQVLINLMVNAIQAMPNGGKLHIQTEVYPENVSLIVEDTGIGMDKDTLEKIFLPFFTTKDVGQGTGLGLAVVHGIVSSHGGTINVRSEPGKGSRFEIVLPIHIVRNADRNDPHGEAD